MTREEIRQMAREWDEKMIRGGWEPLNIPDPEPAYWDNFPHLRPVIAHKALDYPWRSFWEGEYKATTCDGCGQVVWEHESMWQALVYMDGLEYYQGGMELCLPCHKAVNGLRDVIVDPGYETFFVWDYDTVIPSEGVFTEDFWRRKAKLNNSEDEIKGLREGTLTHGEILIRRIIERSKR